MTRISFFETLVFFQKGLSILLYEKIENLLETDEQFEFWFQYCKVDFQALAIKTVERIIKDHPEKEIQIVRVVDKAQYAFSHKDIDDLYRSGFPEDIPLRDEFIPKSIERTVTDDNILRQATRVNRWMHSQCDYLFIYAYLNLPAKGNAYIKYIMEKPQLNVVLLSVDKISNLIDERIESLEGREKIIVKAINEGIPTSSIGKSFNITRNRVDQIAHYASNKILFQLCNEGYFYLRL